jgi:hypothetical protein
VSLADSDFQQLHQRFRTKIDLGVDLLACPRTLYLSKHALVLGLCINRSEFRGGISGRINSPEAPSFS